MQEKRKSKDKFGEAKVCESEQARKYFVNSKIENEVFQVVCKLHYLQFAFQKYRSSHSQMYFRIGALKDFTMFPEKHLCWSLLLINIQASTPVTLLRTDFVKFAKFLRTPIFTEHMRWLLLEISLLFIVYENNEWCISWYVLVPQCLFHFIACYLLLSISFLFLNIFVDSTTFQF